MTSTGSVKAILLVDVEHLGHRGDVVSVARGYLRNYLQPRHLAEQASPARIAEVDRVRSPALAAGGEERRRGARDRAR